jgi:type IV pilus biogenesis protein CpaD/CtpE
MKLLVPVVMAVAALSLSGCSKRDADSGTQNKPDDVLIEVNGKVLTRGEAQKLVEQRLGGPPPADFTKERINAVRNMALSQVVDQFVKRTLLLEEADKFNITASEKEIEKGLSDIRKATSAKGGTNTTASVDSDIQRREVVVGIRIEKLLAKKLPVKTPPDSEIDAFIEKNRAKLTVPDKGMVPREQVIRYMQTAARKRELFEYLRQLQKKAEIKHADNVLPPKYPETDGRSKAEKDAPKP